MAGFLSSALGRGHLRPGAAAPLRIGHLPSSGASHLCLWYCLRYIFNGPSAPGSGSRLASMKYVDCMVMLNIVPSISRMVLVAMISTPDAMILG